jgi:hypothetical protein
MRIEAALMTLGVIFASGGPGATEPFVHNYAEWRALPAVARDVYAMGLWDSYTGVVDSRDSIAVVQALGDCAHYHGGFDTSMLVHLIDSWYNNHQDQLHQPPMTAFANAAWVLCRPFINAERAKLGLGPLAPAPP